MSRAHRLSRLGLLGLVSAYGVLWALSGPPGFDPENHPNFCGTPYAASQASAALHVAPLLSFLAVPLSWRTARRATRVSTRLPAACLLLLNAFIGLAAWQLALLRVF